MDFPLSSASSTGVGLTLHMAGLLLMTASSLKKLRFFEGGSMSSLEMQERLSPGSWSNLDLLMASHLQHCRWCKGNGCEHHFIWEMISYETVYTARINKMYLLQPPRTNHLRTDR